MECQTIQDKVLKINQLLAEVNKSIGVQNSMVEKDLRIKFPRGQIRRADVFRKQLNCVNDPVLKANISYHLMLSDLYSWLLNRTDIFGTIKEMIIKNQIVTMASIVESLLVIHSSRNRGFNKRVEALDKRGIIKAKTKKNLFWLWEIRTGVHLFELSAPEYKKYSYSHFKNVTEAVSSLVQDLNAYCLLSSKDIEYY